MRLMNENTVFLWFGEASETQAPPQVWRRCLPAVSRSGTVPGSAIAATSGRDIL